MELETLVNTVELYSNSKNRVVRKIRDKTTLLDWRKGNDFLFEILGGSKIRGFWKSGFHCPSIVLGWFVPTVGFIVIFDWSTKRVWPMTSLDTSSILTTRCHLLDLWVLLLLQARNQWMQVYFNHHVKQVQNTNKVTNLWFKIYTTITLIKTALGVNLGVPNSIWFKP